MARSGQFYMRFMDDILVLAPTRWRFRKAVKAVLVSLTLEKYPDKTFVGRIERGFDFLVAERAAIPPSGAGAARLVEAPPLPEDYRPRGGAPSHGAPRPALDRDPAAAHRPSPRPSAAKMSVLCTNDRASTQPAHAFVTQ